MNERFAVLDHDWPEPHRDLFLQRDGILLAWRLPAGNDFPFPLPAIASAEHRLIYLDYEGPVSGNRGTVSRWDAGTLAWLSHSPDDLKFELNGSQLQGTFQLQLVEGDVWQFNRCYPQPEGEA